MTHRSAPPNNASDPIGEWLESGAAFGDEHVRRIDTHSAHVYVAGNRAWKRKRSVRFAFLDFSTAELRRNVLLEELRLNRRTAPNLYLGVHAVTRDETGGYRLDGEGEIADWLLEMRRFPDDALLDCDMTARSMTDAQWQGLADSIACLHEAADIIHDGVGAARLLDVVAGNAESMARFPAVLDTGDAEVLTAQLQESIRQHAALLDQRVRQGRVRHGHGDLHLANIALIDGRPTLFDCLEFNRALATTDVLYDLAFLLMDLWRKGLKREANLVFNRYLDRSEADEGAVALLPLFMAIRASVRAHVVAAQSTGENGDGAATQARVYLALALKLLLPTPARLCAIGGFSGSGKSTLARQIGGAIGRPPGARILRSDVLRKRLAGVQPETNLPSSAYTAEASDRVYREIGVLAESALGHGACVIADAVFGKEAERQEIKAVAGRAGCPFTGFWLDLDEAERVRRIESRGPDASDADANVARFQSENLVPPSHEWVHLPAGKDLVATAEKLQTYLD